MSPITSILLPLDGSPAAAQGVGCAVWLAERLGATVHVVTATASPLPAREALEHLGVPAQHRSRLVLHQASTSAESAVLDAIGAQRIDLVVMAARGDSGAGAADLATLIGHVARAVIEESPVPVVLLPPRYREDLPWSSALVPTGGEAPADDALVTAVRLARALGLKVRVAHCTDHGADAGAAALACYADAPYHEYPERLHELVDRAVACCSREECRCIEEVLLCHGEVAERILDLVERKRTSLLVVGWHGDFAAGHAEVVKRLLGTVTCPVLLVRASPRPPFVLKVGDALEQEAMRGARRS